MVNFMSNGLIFAYRIVTDNKRINMDEQDRQDKKKLGDFQ
jgi:hypothetical protein